MTEEVIEAQEVGIVPDPGTEVIQAPPAVNLFHTTDPGDVLKRAQAAANALMPVVREQGLIVKIQGRDHLTVEAWQTLGAMLGISPVCTWTKKLENGWEARVEARTLDGRVIGAAEAECLTAENRWANADDFAVRSMAQTRATSKALASVLRFVATLGGASGTPAEEMPRNDNPRKKGFASPAQRNMFVAQLKKAGGSQESIDSICGYMTAHFHGGQGGGISKAIDQLMDDATRQEVAAKLGDLTAEWLSKQTDVPADTDGLPDANVPDETVPGDEERVADF